LINQARLEKLFARLVEIDSLTFKEKPVVDFLASQLAELGWQVVVDEAGKKFGSNTGNLIAKLKGRISASTIMFNAHLDTVEPGEGIKARKENGLFVASGETILGADDKAGVAAILEMANVLSDSQIKHGPIEIVFTISEEKGLLGAKHLDFSTLASRCAFVFDAVGEVGEITVKAPYQNSITASILGKASHSGVSPELGINAILAASKAIAQMKLGRIDPETTANVGVIKGGTAANIVPERVEIKAEARSLSENKLVKQTESIINCLRKGAKEEGARLKTETIREYQGFHLRANSYVVSVASRAIKSCGFKLKLISTGGGSDTNVFNAKSIPAIGLAVGYRQPHSLQERIPAEQLNKAARLALAIVETVAS
jgi:tripeptide aminopeptidase